MSIRVRISATSAQPASKRRTQRWVKVVWVIAGLFLAAAVFLLVRPVETTPLSSVPQSIQCGSVLSPNMTGIKEWSELSGVRSLALQAGVSAEKAARGYCGDAFAAPQVVAGWMVAGTLVFGVVGLIGRLRPSIPVRIVE